MPSKRDIPCSPTSTVAIVKSVDSHVSGLSPFSCLTSYVYHPSAWPSDSIQLSQWRRSPPDSSGVKPSSEYFDHSLSLWVSAKIEKNSCSESALAFSQAKSTIASATASGPPIMIPALWPAAPIVNAIAAAMAAPTR